MGAKLFLFKFQNPNAIVLRRIGNIRAEWFSGLESTVEQGIEKNKACSIS